MEYLAVAEYCFADHPGGAPRVAWDIAKAMRDRGHSVTFLCYRQGNAPVGIAEVDGIRVVRFDKSERPAWHPKRMEAIVDSARAGFQCWLGDQRFDVVHVHAPLQGLGVYAALGGDEGGASPRYVYTAHSPLVLEQEIIWRSQGWAGRLKLLFGRAMLADAERRMLNAAAQIHTLSEFTRTKLDEAYGTRARTTVIPHWYARINQGISRDEARKRLGWPANAKIFFTVRGMGPRYGVDIAIRALAPLLTEYGGHFFLAGDGVLRPKLQALAETMDSEGRMHFMGRVSDRDLELAYAAADLFILPTLALECFGLITLEAFAFGCPVLATDVGAIPESMVPVLADLLVPAGDVDALRDVARRFLNGEIKVPDGRTLIEFAAGRYGAPVVIPQLCRLLEAPPLAGGGGS